MELSYEKADILIKKAIEKALKEFKRPISIAICDSYGFLLAFARMEKAPIRSIRISQSKAYTASRMQTNTDLLQQKLQKDNLPLSYFCDDKLTALPGGALLKDKEGNIVGAVGVSGLASAEDQIIANMIAEIFLN